MQSYCFALFGGADSMKTVLIVDDSGFMRNLIKRHIGTLDIDVVGEAENGKIAVEKYIELKPDIVTLDLAMHEHGGLEALQEIKQIDPDAKVIIVCSIAGRSAILEEVKKLGVHAVINKPLKEDELADAVKELL